MMKLAYPTLILWSLLSLVACSPSRNAQKYDYLTKNKTNPPTSTSGSSRNTKEVGIVVNTAKSYVGTPYKYGGMSKRGMDCSGLVYTSYQAIDKELPRTAAQLAETGKKVSRQQLQNGDLVFFNAKGSGNKINHVGLVVSVKGNEIQFIHSTTSRGVRIDNLGDSYWSPRFRKAVRIMS